MKRFCKKDTLLRLIKFGIVGAIGIGVNYFFWIVFEKIFGIPDKIALGFAIEISIISNFILNNFWTFKDRKDKKNFFLQMVKFNIISFGGLVLNIITYTILKDYFDIYKYFAEFFGISIGFFWNFFFSNFFVWRKDKFSSKIYRKKKKN